MAKFLTLIACTVLCYGLAQATLCVRNSECQSHECCVTFNPPRGRRGLASNLQNPDLGRCHTKGYTGSACIVNPHLYNEKYVSCPCSDNYYCQGTGRFNVPQGEIGTCQPNRTIHTTSPSHTLGRSCSLGSHCGTHECCVSDIRPIGKRMTSLGGHCKVMGTRGSNCYVKSGSVKPSHMTTSCPCSSGLTCHGKGMFDVPLGEIGVCQ